MTSLAALNPDELDDVADAPEDEAPKRRRPRPVIAQPGEDIPDDINAALLADLAFERALGMARGLAGGVSIPSDFDAGGHRAVWTQPSHSEAPAGVLAEA